PSPPSTQVRAVWPKPRRAPRVRAGIRPGSPTFSATSRPSRAATWRASPAMRSKRAAARARTCARSASGGRQERGLGAQIAEELQQVLVHEVRSFLLNPVPTRRHVAQLERAREQHLHVVRALLLERDVVLAPDDERRRRDRRPVGEGAARRWEGTVTEEEAPHAGRQRGERFGAAERGPVVVDGPTKRPWLGGRVAKDLEVGVRDRRLANRRAPDRLTDPPRPVGAEQRLGEPRQLEEEHVPAARQLPQAGP